VTENRRTSFGVDENVAAALAYSLGWLSGIVLYLAEPANSFVRFHALQSTFFFGAASAAFLVCLAIPLLGWILAIVVFYGSLAVWLLLLFKAYKGERFSLPIVGRMVADRL